MIGPMRQQRRGGGGGGGRRFRGGPPRFRGGRRPPRKPTVPDDPVTALSKVLSFALRHQPEEFGLNTDERGFVPLNELVLALQERPKWVDITEEEILKIVDGGEKLRFEVRDGLIRARYGHSFDVQPASDPVEPPEKLYHGTPRRAVPVVMDDGLRSMRRRFVHLSKSLDTAKQVGERRDPNSIVIEIHAKEAHENGVKFYSATEEIYLCENVPPPYLRELSAEEASGAGSASNA